MKHTLLFIALAFATFTYAQISPINATPKTTEWIYNIYHEIYSDRYTMCVFSDNEFEDNAARIVLGVGLEQSIESLNNLLEASKNVNTEFELQGYYFVVDSKYIRVRNMGKLDYTAGTYKITQYMLNTYKDKLNSLLNPTPSNVLPML